MPRRNYKISYVKKPLAKKSKIATGLNVAAALLCFFALRLSVAAQGNGGLNVGAIAFSSLMFSLFAVTYAGLSFREQDKNYILSRANLLIGLLLMIFWVGLIIAARKG